MIGAIARFGVSTGVLMVACALFYTAGKVAQREHDQGCLDNSAAWYQIVQCMDARP